jgi:hypothetical protein
LTPQYKTLHFSDQEKENTLVKVISGHKVEDEKVIQIGNNVDVYASILHRGSIVQHKLNKTPAYLHLASSFKPVTDPASIKVNGHILHEGDGAFLEGIVTVECI